MTIPKPVGPYAEEMLGGGGWPEVDEAVLSDRADQLVQHLRQVTSALMHWQAAHGELFSGGLSEVFEDRPQFGLIVR